jgi:hypothetical protein
LASHSLNASRVGSVLAIEFVYPKGKDVTAAIAEYQQSLGAVHDHAVTDSLGRRLERWTWSDSVTVFEFVRLGGPKNPVRIWSSVRDKPRHQ